MNREIYKVFATQIVASAQNPQGILSNVTGYPKDFDSRDYNRTDDNPNGDGEIALLDAKADYSAEIVTLRTANNPNRVGWTVAIYRTSDGREIARYPFGGYPDLTPTPPPETQTTEQNQNQGEGT